MPTKLKKTPKRKNNNLRSVSGVNNSKEILKDSERLEELDGNPVLGVEPILESQEFMNSMDQLREKLNSRSKFGMGSIDLKKISSKKILKSRLFLFILGFLLGALVFYFLI